MHLRQNFLYSEDANKNPVYLFVLLYLTVFLIYQYQYHQKQRFASIAFAKTTFWAKKIFKKWSLLGEEKNPKPWNSLKSSLSIFFNYIKPVTKNFVKFFGILKVTSFFFSFSSINLALISNFQKWMQTIFWSPVRYHLRT